MKSIFYIHSFITYITALSIIEYLRLIESDILFLYGRNFDYDKRSNITIIKLSKKVFQLSKVPSYGERFLLFKHSIAIIELDLIINKFINKADFVAYLPLTKNFLMQTIATHKKCKELAFLEEGLLSYTDDFYKKTSTEYKNGGKFSRLIRYPKHLNRSFFYREYNFKLPLKLYLLTEFHNTKSNFDVITISKIISPANELNQNFNNSHIIIFQPTVENKYTTIDMYLKVIEQVLIHLSKNGISQIYLKFHPAQQIEVEIENLVKKLGINYLVIPNNLSVEAVLLNSKNVSLYGLFSSLLYYASCWGHRAFSFSFLLEKFDEKYKEKIKQINIPSIYFDKVHNLEELSKKFGEDS